MRRAGLALERGATEGLSRKLTSEQRCESFLKHLIRLWS